MTQAIITAGTLFKVGDGATGAAVNEVEQIVITGTPTGGSLAVLYSNEGYIYERATAAWSATAATFATNIQTALESMVALNPGDVTVTSVDATHYNVTFLGAKAGKNVSKLQVDASALTGATSATVNTTIEGHGIGQSFVAVAEVTGVPWPTMTRDTNEATPINSLSGYKEFVSGLKDGGEITVEVNYIPADPTQNGATGLISYFEGGAAKDMKIVLPDAALTTFNFTGVPTQFAPAGGGPGDIIKLACRFKLTGPVTLTVGG